MNVLVRDQTDKLIIAGYYFAGEEDGSRKARTDRQTRVYGRTDTKYTLYTAIKKTGRQIERARKLLGDRQTSS